MILNLLLTIYFWIITVISVLISFISCIIVYPFIDQKTFARLFEKVCGYIIIYSMVIPGFWKIIIKDYRQNPTWDEKRYVIIANHISFIDSLLGILIPLKKKYMMARIFTYIPIFGWITKSAGFVFVDNKDKTTLYDAVDKAVNSMKDGCSFMLYPEGKRTHGNLEKFKTGAYRIAQKTRVKILPLCLKGTNVAMPIGGIVSTATIEMHIGEPFYVNDGWNSIQESINKSKNFILNYNM